MPLFAFQAINDKGRRIKGSMSAVNEADLEERLRQMNLDLIDFKAIKERKVILSSRVSLEDLIILCIHFEQLGAAGVPILDALSDIRETAENQHLKNIMTDILESVKGGALLSAAMADHPRIFNSVFVSLVAAGERSGNLDHVFRHLATHLKWVNNIQKKIKKAVYYPSFLLVLMTGIITLMMLFVIPKLSAFLQAQDFELPFYTQALISTSNFFANYWYVMIAVPIGIVVMIKTVMRYIPPLAYIFDKIALKIPYIGPTMVKIELARFSHFFSIMYRSGIGILDCLDVAASVVQNRVIKESTMIARSSVGEGNSLTDSLSLTNRFPHLVIRMFKVGEDSGNLDKTLDNINFFYDREVEDSVSNMVGVIQPALTILMGLLMMWVSLAVFGPLYNSFSQMNF